MGGNLQDLSRNLGLVVHDQPVGMSREECIRKTLIAHGFFGHHPQRSSQDHSPTQSDDLKPSKSKEKKCGISEEDKKRTTQLISHYKEGKEFHTLKEPRSLFHKSRTAHNQQSKRSLPLWPAEVPCLPRRVKFMTTPPPFPEPFYKPEREVISPKIRSGEGGGTVVYSNQPGPEKYFTHARGGPSPNLQATPTRSPDSTTLEFESRFESGNLGKAVQVGRWDYELYLRYDLYTKKHTQWFFFSVRNMRPGQTYRFTIVNLYKAGSLYNEGMQPVTYSEREAQSQGLGWHRAGHNIKYFQTPIRRLDTRQESYYYGLTWSHTFRHARDTCYFAHCYPYTYSDLQDYLQAIASHPVKSQFCKQRTLCHSIAGNPVPLLTITSPVLSPEESRAKRAIVVTARVHPGETNGSWMMKGFLDFLTGPTPDAKVLRDTFVFKVVPMLNPDGVTVGNYRCTLAGRDLNRNYRSKLKDSYPTVWHTKSMVRRLTEERDVVLYCDLHGHSRKHNVFIYGCDSMADPDCRLHSRVFPRMLAKNAPTKFSYKSSHFNVHKSKEGTGRVVMWREMGIRNSYTMEATFCGSLLGKEKGRQFNTSDLESMGYHFCDTLLDYFDPDQNKVEHILRELEDEHRQSILARLAAMGRDIPPGVDPLDLSQDPDLLSEDDSSNAGSDSSESDGPPVHLLCKEKRRKKKKLKSRKERNKHKALLKLTHHKAPSPSHPSAPQTQPTAPIPSTEGPALAGHLLLGPGLPGDSAAHFHYSHLEAARNGGIPIFIQERLEERQKRRGDMESTDRLINELDYVEMVTMKYMRQGLPQSSVQETTTQDPRSSMSLLPRPSCPMNIGPAPVCESRQLGSRISSKASLPHLTNELGPLPSSGSHTAFASRYMANHLCDVINSTSNTQLVSVAGAQSTRNLANLSKLFRQLRPHLLHSMARDTHHHGNPHSESGVSEAPRKGRDRTSNGAANLEESKRESAQRLHGRVEFTVPASDQGRLQSSTEFGPQLVVTEKRERGHQQSSVHGGEGFPNRPSRHGSARKKAESGSLLGQSRLSPGAMTEHDRKTLADIRSSYSSLSNRSELTSSWESFTTAAPISKREHRKEKDKGRDNSLGGKDHYAEHKQLTAVSTGAHIEQPSDNRQLKVPGGGKAEERDIVPKSQSAPNTSTSPSFQSSSDTLPLLSPLSSVPNHVGSQNVSSAMRTHTRRIPTLTETLTENVQDAQKLFREPIAWGDSGTAGGENGVDHATHRPHDAAHDTPCLPISRSFPDQHHRPSTTAEGTRVSEWVRGCGDGKGEVANNTSQSPEDNAPRMPDTYLPIPISRVYSSKPPSRYGTRPSSEDGVLPATVSLMLTGRVRSRPVTMYSSHRPRPLHVRYYSPGKKTGYRHTK